MPVPGYDPEDVENMLESQLDEDSAREAMSEEDWESYQNDEERLVDVLEDDEIKRILGED
jgi:hypothetical protein